MFLSEVDC